MDFFSDNSIREKFLLMLFPAAIVMAIYSVLFALPIQKEKAALEAEFISLQNSAVSKDAAANSKQNLEKESESLARLRNRVSLSHEQIRELCGGWRSRDSRLEMLEKVTGLMQESNLSIVSQGRNVESVIVSSHMRDLFQIMDEQANQDPVEFWPVEIKGAYFDLIAFLIRVEKDAKSIIPVGITMKSGAAGSSQKTWTLVFVI